MAEKIKKLFKLSYEEVLTRAQTKHDKLQADIAEWTLKFPWIDAVYVASYQTDITTALLFPGDGVLVSNIKVLTEDVRTTMAEGNSALTILDRYAQVTYQDSLAKQRVFGQDTWGVARNDENKLVKALQQAHLFANQAPYKAALLAKGYTQTQIDALLTIGENITLKDGLQENAKKGRTVTTEERIQVFNVVWKRDQILAICADVVYENEPANRAIFQLYPSGSEPETSATYKVFLPGGTAAVGINVHLTNVAGFADKTTDGDGLATFTGNSLPDSLDAELSGPDVVTQNVNGQLIIAHDNSIIAVEMVPV